MMPVYFSLGRSGEVGTASHDPCSNKWVVHGKCDPLNPVSSQSSGEYRMEVSLEVQNLVITGCCQLERTFGAL